MPLYPLPSAAPHKEEPDEPVPEQMISQPVVTPAEAPTDPSDKDAAEPDSVQPDTTSSVDDILRQVQNLIDDKSPCPSSERNLRSESQKDLLKRIDEIYESTRKKE